MGNNYHLMWCYVQERGAYLDQTCIVNSRDTVLMTYCILPSSHCLVALFLHTGFSVAHSCLLLSQFHTYRVDTCHWVPSGRDGCWQTGELQLLHWCVCDSCAAYSLIIYSVQKQGIHIHIIYMCICLQHI